MIRDARVLQDEFLPKDVQHRNAEINHLSSALEPCLRGERPENALVFGPTGAGKTTIARYTLERIREELLDVHYQYVNCWQDYNRFRVVYRLLEGLGQTVGIHRQSTPKDELLETLRSSIEHRYLVILDEADQLEDVQVLYDLYTLPNVTMIAIANREAELFADMDQRISSRLRNSERVHFERYRVDELVAILEDRVRWGLEPDVVDRDRLRDVADAAAGDARIAIGILRSAARYAQRNRLDAITGTAIERAIPDAKTQVQQKNVGKLNAHQSVIYEVVREHGPIAPGELYDRYEAQVDDPKTKRTMRNYLRKMVHYNLVDAEGESKARRYSSRPTSASRD